MDSGSVFLHSSEWWVRIFTSKWSVRPDSFTQVNGGSVFLHISERWVHILTLKWIVGSYSYTQKNGGSVFFHSSECWVHILKYTQVFGGSVFLHLSERWLRILSPKWTMAPYSYTQVNSESVFLRKVFHMAPKFMKFKNYFCCKKQTGRGRGRG